MGWIFSLITLINNLFSAWRAYEDAVQAKREREAAEREKNRNQAVDDSKKAETDEEIFDSQIRVIDNRP